MNRVLVAGIGNVFMGDDAFGVEVARQLLQRPALESVTIRDFGTRGLDLAYTLLDGFEALLLVDAAPRGHAPGTLTVLEPELSAGADTEDVLGTGHAIDPQGVFALLRALGSTLPKTRIVGCEPLSFGSEEQPMLELSAPVREAVLRAVRLVEHLARELRDDLAIGAASHA